jgi:DNA-binding NarL/FixJ family response regulator
MPSHATLTPAAATALTGRELEVVALVADGLSNQQIAARLHVSPRTVQAHVAGAMRKLGASSRTGLAVTAIRAGLVPLFPQSSGPSHS